MERIVIGVAGPADRLLATGLNDLRGLLEELRDNVVVVGGLMARAWLHLRPVEDIAPRATADIDLGVDRKGLHLTASTERVRPLLEERDYEQLPGDEGFRFQKSFGEGQTLLVDLFVAKGASREEPPLLEKGVATLAAPGLVYALARKPYFVSLAFADGDVITEIELPLPTLDAAFVLKAALAESGVRMRHDRRTRDRVDAVMLAAACAQDEDALSALSATTSREARKALKWIQSQLDHPRSAVAQTLERYLDEQHQIPGGGAWAVGVADQLAAALRDNSTRGPGRRSA